MPGLMRYGNLCKRYGALFILDEVRRAFEYLPEVGDLVKPKNVDSEFLLMEK